MAERSNTPDPIQQGGWHEPKTPPSAKPIAKQAKSQSTWRVTALPSNLAQTPQKQGDWHLPKPENTTFGAADQIVVKRKGSEAAATIRPEDLIADILGQAKKESPKVTSSTLPEDMIFPASATAPVTSAVPTLGDLLRPEDEILPKSESTETTALEPLPLDDLGDMGGLEALGALDDVAEEPVSVTSSARGEDPFSISEYLALAHLEQQAAKSEDNDTVPLNADDLSPAAQAALLAGVRQATEMLPKEQQTQSTAGEDAAAYARRMAQQYAQGETSGVDLASQVAQSEDAASYARRMAQQYAQGEDSNATVNFPLTSAQPAQTSLTPQEEALAEQFRRTAQGVNDLRQQYQAGLITQADVQNRQRDYQILDERNGDWWMMGIESGEWYRFDRNANNWVESQPPVPLNRPSVPTATSGLNPDEVVGASLPYFTTNQPVQEYSGQPTQGYTLGSDTPVPNPNQPQYDPNLTMVSDVASLNTLPSAAATMQGMSYVDQNTVEMGYDYQNTMPMQTVAGIPAGDVSNLMVDAPSYDEQGVPNIYAETRGRENQNMMRTLAVLGLVAGVVIVIGLVAGVVLLQVYYNNTIEPYTTQIAGLRGYKPSFQTAQIMDANGDLIVELNSQDGGARKVIPLEEMSPFVLHAVISTENPTFYNDPGFDLFAVARALLQNLSAGDIQSGASTITQQLARNLILKDTSPTAERKITEIFVAMEISRNYTKNEILQLYMNETFFGNQSYGVEAAAEFYFDKTAIDLNMGESALLAGIISSPAQYDPIVNLEAAKSASRVVISRMLETNCLQFQHGQYVNAPFCINPTTTVESGGGQALLVIPNDNGTFGGLLALQLAQVETRKFLPREAQFKYPHFVNYVQAQIEQEFGVNAMFARGFTIYTTLNPRIQDEAEAMLKQQVTALSINGVNTGAVMVTDPQTGAIRAMVGSPDFTDVTNNGQVDNTRTWQQPGSTIKAVVYTAALEGAANGYLTPASILWDVPSSYGISGQAPYQPTNFSNQFYGPTPMRFALANSYNVSAVKAYEFIGNEKFVETANRMGLGFLPEATFGLPSALGANEVRLIDMMKVYGTLANNGVQVPLYSIDRITEGSSGTPLEVPLVERAANQQVVTPQVAYLMQNILSDDNARSQQFGLNSLLTLANRNIPTQDTVAAKSGTSNDGRDLWTMGFTSNTVVGVWLGTWDNSPTRGVSGANAPATVWNRIMGIAVEGRTPRPFQRPSGVVQATVCRETGALDDPNVPCSTRANEIFINTQSPPPAGGGFVQTLNIDSWTGFVANEWCSENVVSQVYANISDAFAVNWIINTPQGRNWANLVGLPTNLQQAPTVACSQGQVLPSVYLNNPINNQTVTGVLTVTGQISAPDFQRYDLEYATAQNPTAFQRITTNTQQFVSGGSTLGTWDTATVPNGSYILRLVAVSTKGGFIYRTAQINIQNVLPTPTPMPLPSSTPNVFIPTPIQFVTPIPFDPVGTTPTATLAP